MPSSATSSRAIKEEHTLERVDKDFRRPQPPTRIIRLKEVRNSVGLGRSTIYRWMAQGSFPKPVRRRAMPLLGCSTISTNGFHDASPELLTR